MTISKTTELGTINVSDLIFAQIIERSLRQTGCRDKVWPATKKGRQIGNDAKVSAADIAREIEVEASSDGSNFELTFNVIIKFGAGIRKITDLLTDYISETVLNKHGRKPDLIRIRIVGVRSKNIAKRNLEVVKRYETL